MAEVPFGVMLNTKKEERSVLAILDEATGKYAERAALIYLGKAVTFARLKELIDRFATALFDLEVKRGDKVIIYVPNSVQFVIAFYGVIEIGAAAVPISPIYTPVEVRYMSQDCGAETIVCQDTNFGYVKEIMPQSPLKRIIYTNLADPLPWWKKLVGFAFDKVPRGRVEKGENIYYFLDLLKYPPNSPKIEIKPSEEVCRILYTGGTTGLPKGVTATYTQLYYTAHDMIEMCRGTHIEKGQSRFVYTLPLFHALGQTVFTGMILALGNTAVIMPQVQVDAILECIQRYKADLFFGVPMLYRMILENDRLEQYDLKSLRYCWSGGDVLPEAIFEQWQKKFGVPIHQLYGSTEGELHTYTPLSKKPVAGSVGIYATVGGRKQKLLNPDTLEPVPDKTPGELLVSAPFLVNRYLNKPEETASSFVEIDGDTYYRTKDILMMKDGELHFVDRSADVIKHKAYRVAAAEVEAVLQDHPAVMAACVVGVPDSNVGERIKAFVVLKEGAKGVSSNDLVRWCRERLTSYKVPQYIEFRDMLPKSKVGKLLRREMREEERMKIAPKGEIENGSSQS